MRVRKSPSYQEDSKVKAPFWDYAWNILYDKGPFSKPDFSPPSTTSLICHGKSLQLFLHCQPSSCLGERFLRSSQPPVSRSCGFWHFIRAGPHISHQCSSKRKGVTETQSTGPLQKFLGKTKGQWRKSQLTRLNAAQFHQFLLTNIFSSIQPKMMLEKNAWKSQENKAPEAY